MNDENVNVTESVVTEDAVTESEVITSEGAYNPVIEEKPEIPEEYAAKILAITMENEGLKAENETLNKIIAELKEKLRATETELLNRNDLIKEKEQQITELTHVCDKKAKEAEYYKREVEGKKPDKLHVGVGFIDLDEPTVSLEEVLLAVKSAGCTNVSFSFYGADEFEEDEE